MVGTIPGETLYEKRELHRENENHHGTILASPRHQRESTKGLKLVESEMLHHDAHVTQHADSQICASEIATRSLTVLQCDEERQSTTCCLVRGTYVQCLIQSSLVPSRWWHRVIIIMTAQHDDFPVHTAHVNVGM